MTQKVSPSPGHVGFAYETATAIWKGSATAGWVSPAGENVLAHLDPDLMGTPLGGFALSTSSTSFDFTVSDGEGFVGGAWVADDTPRTVAGSATGGLNANDANQLIKLGWSKGSTDVVRIGTDAAFGPNDHRIPIYQVSTDASGVIQSSIVDLRPLGRQIDAPNAQYDDALGGTRPVSEATHAQHAETAGAVTGPVDAETFGGYTPTQIASGIRTVNLPVAEMLAGDTYTQVERVANGTTFRLLSFSKLTKTGTNTTDLRLFVSEAGQTTDLYSNTGFIAEGTLASPLLIFTGPGSLSLGIKNTAASAAYDASARFTYFIS